MQPSGMLPLGCQLPIAPLPAQGPLTCQNSSMLTGDAESLGEGEFGEALRVSAEFVDVAIPLLLTAFPGRQLMRAPIGRLTGLYVDPPLDSSERRRLLGYLHELVARREWALACAVAREVTDERGTRTELLVPLPPAAYGGGEALVGPFPDFQSAQAWTATVREPGLAVDTLRMEAGVVVDLFLLGEMLSD